jgi:hypothetical protein
MKKYLTILFSIMTQYAMGQAVTTGSPDENTTGPVLQSITVTRNGNSDLHFSTSDDLSNVKSLLNYYTVEIKSAVPWTLSVEAVSDIKVGALQAAGQSGWQCALNIKRNNDQQYYPVTQGRQVIMQSNNNNPVNTYLFELAANPGWNRSGGIYDIDIVFTLSPK